VFADAAFGCGARQELFHDGPTRSLAESRAKRHWVSVRGKREQNVGGKREQNVGGKRE
jgi:hypothetical protein